VISLPCITLIIHYSSCTSSQLPCLLSLPFPIPSPSLRCLLYGRSGEEQRGC
jgi:hypothetical protein